MSIMSIPVSRRSARSNRSARAVVATDVPDGAGCSLAELERGTVVHVVGVSDQAHPAIARRLFDLGFAPGAEVEMLRRAPMADPVVFRVAGYDIALRRAEARCIQVATPA